MCDTGELSDAWKLSQPFDSTLIKIQYKLRFLKFSLANQFKNSTVSTGSQLLENLLYFKFVLLSAIVETSSYLQT